MNNPNIPSVEEAQEAVRIYKLDDAEEYAEEARHFRKKYNKHPNDTIIVLSSTTATLLRAIEAGKYAIVPCELDEEICDDWYEVCAEAYRQSYLWGRDRAKHYKKKKGFDGDFIICTGQQIEPVYKAAIKAAPQEEILKELFTCKETG